MQVVEYNKHHPLSFAVDELLKVLDGVVRDVSELQTRKTKEAKDAAKAAAAAKELKAF